MAFRLVPLVPGAGGVSRDNTVAAKRDQAHLSFRSAEGPLGAPAAGAARASVLGTATGSGSGSATAGGAAGAADFGGAAAAITA